MGETIAVTQKLALLYDVKVITALAIFMFTDYCSRDDSL